MILYNILDLNMTHTLLLEMPDMCRDDAHCLYGYSRSTRSVQKLVWVFAVHPERSKAFNYIKVCMQV